MASTVVADPGSEFEFNPSAPEFIPQQQDVALLRGLPGMPPTLLPTFDGSFSPRSLPHTRCCDDPAAVLASGATSQGSEEAEDPADPGLLLCRDRVAGALEPRRSATKARPGAADSVGGAPPEKQLWRPSARRAVNAPGAPTQAATLVVKNLALDLEKADVMKFLEERGAAPAEVDLHRDATGNFRGTVFARYHAPGKARAALEKLGMFPEFGGRKARVEIQKSKANFGRKCLEAGLPQEELEVVREEIERFVNDPARGEVGLPAGLTVQQRKYAHSLGERHNLVHATRQGEGGERFVYLSKARGEPLHGRKKAHSATNCTGSSRATGGSQGSKAKRRQALSADDALLCEGPPGIETFPYLTEHELSGDLLGEDSILSPDMAVAPRLTSSPILCAAPGLPLPPGFEFECPVGGAGLALQGPLPPPALAVPPKALGGTTPAPVMDVAATQLCQSADSLETAGSLLVSGSVTEE
mmetsp:Transcript_70568/g.210430  ORF Transcript_70568/g.210430 Transcript_70568/m.210430 type:complete len:472 (+) Transcript_70568:133-1548(+)